MTILTVDQIAVGSTNPVKLAAVRNVTRRIWPQATVVAVEVDSGVRNQPLSEDEAIAGATMRARRAHAQLQAEISFGLEAYAVDTPHGMFVSGWVAAVAHGVHGQAEIVGLGASGRFQLPERLAQGVRQGAELGPLMDRHFHGENIKQKEGAVGILTNGLLARTEALQVGVIFALTRFVNLELYD